MHINPSLFLKLNNFLNKLSKSRVPTNWLIGGCISDNIKEFYSLFAKYVSSTALRPFTTDETICFQVLYGMTQEFRRSFPDTSRRFAFIRNYESQLQKSDITVARELFRNPPVGAILSEIQKIKLKARFIIHALGQGQLLQHYSDLRKRDGFICTMIHDIVQQLRHHGICQMVQAMEDVLKNGPPLTQLLSKFHPRLLSNESYSPSVVFVESIR